MKRVLFAYVVAIVWALAPAIQAAQVTVFAAASLTESLKEIGAAHERQVGDKVVFNFAGSGPLARQIEAGAPADVFVSADEPQMDSLEKKDLLAPNTRRALLSNQLVMVALADNPVTLRSPADLAGPGVRRVALGDPASVPAGTYARQYLTKVGLWSGLERKVVPCENVRAVLAAVESGNVDAGFVYLTDAAVSKKVKISFAVPLADGPKIVYPAAMIKDAKQPEAARRFLTYLAGPEAGKVFSRHGFLLSAPPEK